MAATVFRRGPLRAWARWKQRKLRGIPHPTDRAVASVPGDPAIECVALGNGAISGWGVASHQVGLVGAIARSLSRRFGHGAVVRAAIDQGWVARDMLREAPRQPWQSAQVGILCIGPNEVLRGTRLRRAIAELEELVVDVRSRMPQDAVLLVIGIPPLHELQLLRGIGTPAYGALLARYNDLADRMCRAHPGVRFVRLPSIGQGTVDAYRSREDYAAWAALVVAAIPADPAQVALPVTAPDERDAAVEQLDLLDSPPEERFDRIVRLARSLFRAQSAAFTVLHGTRQWHKSRVGIPVDEIPREFSSCEIAAREGEPLVVGDAAEDARFADFPLVRAGGVRFYAGYPLRAPQGHFVGALCVFDPEPRDPEDVDVALLRELALRMEAELEQTGAA